MYSVSESEKKNARSHVVGCKNLLINLESEKRRTKKRTKTSARREEGKSTHSTNISEEINRASFCLGGWTAHGWSADLLREQLRNRAFRETSCNHFLPPFRWFDRVSFVSSSKKRFCSLPRSVFLSLYLSLSKSRSRFRSLSIRMAGLLKRSGRGWSLVCLFLHARKSMFLTRERNVLPRRRENFLSSSSFLTIDDWRAFVSGKYRQKYG